MNINRGLALKFSAIFLGIVAFYLAVRFGLFWYLNPNSRMPGDFQVSRVAAERLIAGQNIYVPGDASPFKYSPTFAYLFRFTVFLLEEKLSAAVWMAASALSFLGALHILMKRLVADATNPKWLLVLLFLGTALSWHGFMETLSYGQADMILGAGVLLIATRTTLQARAFLWALVLMIKPHYGLVFLATSLARPRREAAITLGATTAAYLLPAPFIGFGELGRMLWSWVECLRIQQTTVFMTGNINQSVASAIARIAGHHEIVGVLTGLLILLYVSFIGYLGWRRRSADPFDLLGLGLGGYLLFSPLSWRWLICFWIPIVAILARPIRSRPEPALIVWAALALATDLPLPNDTVSAWGLFTWAGAALFVAAATRCAGPRKA